MFLIHDGPEVELQAQVLLREAERQTNLSDWGDRRFELGLRALIESLSRDAMHRYNATTRASIGRSLVAVLANRLRVLDDRKRFPQIAQVEIQRPIFFIGMGRTGSTFIQTVAAQDPGNLSPELWETILPSPPPRFGIDAPRRARLEQIWRWYMQDMEGIESAHPYFIEDGFRALAECGSIGQIACASYQYVSYLGAASYMDWFMRADQTEAVDFHHKFLQHLQWGREGRTWISKAVEHGVYLDALLKQYPDALFVWTHRDPLAQAASLASIIGTIRAKRGDLGGGTALGTEALDAIRLTVDRGMQIRATADEKRFHDVFYPSLTADPIGTIREIYRKSDRELTAEAELNMLRWLRNNRVDRGGTHTYTAGQFGLSQERIQREMPEYLNCFGAALQHSRAAAQAVGR